MKTGRLRPSLATIEARLCGPSDALLRRWLEGDNALPADLLAQLENDAAAVWRRHQLELTQTDDTAATETDQPITERPARPDLLMRFSNSVRRREALSAANFSTVPTPGQIRWVERLCAPDGTTVPWDFPQRLMVVLRAPAKADSPIWDAWMVAPDVDYAAYWDMVLEPRDEPRDPRAEVAQAWNTLLVDTRGTGGVAGQLTGERLAALQALSHDFVDGPSIGTDHAAPGELIERTVAGHRVVTGTPYGAPESDPRLEYQSLYHTAAEPLRRHARAVLGVMEREMAAAQSATAADVVLWIRDAVAQIVERFREQAASAALAFQEIAFVPTPASAEPAEAGTTRCVEFANLLRIDMFGRVTGDVAVINARLIRIGPQPVAIEVLQGGITTVVETLDEARPSVDVPLSGASEVVIRILEPTRAEVILPALGG